MIQEKQSQATVIEHGQSNESIGMSLDLSSAQVLMQMLSKNLYSDPIGSTVRECASNALDSHRNAGVSDAIVVALKANQDNNIEFSVEDFGVGLDDEDVKNIISKYGNSTKRNDDKALGMFGLGFKAPLAYSSSFYFVCRKDGVERKYMMYEGEDVNTIDLLFEQPTTERNGVKIIVPVKYSDRLGFYAKITEQLAYFENVFFDVSIGDLSVPNNFSIERAEDFQSSELCSSQYLHLCLDNVYYPLDFNKLGITAINVPLGLRFGLSDGIFPTPNREQIIYTSETREKILDKIKKVADILTEKYNKTVDDCDDVFEIFRYYENRTRTLSVGSQVLNIAPICQYSGINLKEPKSNNYKLINLKKLCSIKDIILGEYQLATAYRNSRFNTFAYNSNSFNNITKKGNYLIDSPLLGNKRAYIKSLLPVNSYENVMFYKKKPFTLFRKNKQYSLYSNYYYILDLHKYDRSEWRAHIIEFQSLVKELTANLTLVDDIQIPQAWLDARKKAKVVATGTGVRKTKMVGDISCRVADKLLRYSISKSSKLVPTVLKADKLESDKTLYVYGRQKDEELMDKLFNASDNGKQKLKLIVLSEREHKVVETLDYHNLISIEEFMKGKHKVFRRMVSGYLIKTLINKNEDVFRKIEIIREISSDLADRLEELKEYARKNNNALGNDSSYEAILAVAQENNLFDECIHTEYYQMKEFLDRFYFLNTFLGLIKLNYSNKVSAEQLGVLKDLFKYHKIKMDYTSYKQPIKEQTN